MKRPLARPQLCQPMPSDSWIRILDDKAGLELILAGIRDGLILMDPSGRVSKMNPAMEHLLGQTDEEARGCSMKQLTGTPEICLLIAGAPSTPGETLMFKGREFEVEAAEIFDNEGGKLGTLVIFRDVTETRAAERQRAEFVSMVTHDLKAPLTTILGYGDLILDGSLGETSPEVRESVAAMAASGRKVAGIIDDFLALSRLEAGQAAPVFRMADVAGVARSVVEGARARAGAAGKTVSLAAPPGLPQAECDARQVERIIANLVDNAVKFTREGGRVSVTLAGAATGDAPALVVTVEDDGVGIPEGELPHIFDPYWRGSGSAGVRGTGLGLAIVKRIADAHRARIEAESEAGKGSRFTLRLPLKQPAKT